MQRFIKLYLFWNIVQGEGGKISLSSLHRLADPAARIAFPLVKIF
jgi:hypothetical protein